MHSEGFTSSLSTNSKTKITTDNLDISGYLGSARVSLQCR